MSVTEQKVQDARLSLSSADDYWAAEVLASLNKERHGRAFEWAKACVLNTFAVAGDSRKYEQELLTSALSCDHPEELRRLSSEAENNQKDELSLAYANLIVAKTLDLEGKPDRAIFFLNAVMRFLGIHYRKLSMPSDELFLFLPSKPL